jgi:riboflavin synthase
MFTGIIECLGLVNEATKHANGNLELSIEASFAEELIIGQSVAHNGICLTVTEIDFKRKTYKVTAIEETLAKTNLSTTEKGHELNLERCMLANGRFDGHIVQGHVDQTAICEQVIDKNGSWHYLFVHEERKENMTVEKGSICVNGVSLTVVTSEKDNFSVAIIPHTFHHTNFKDLRKGMKVNLEFDIFGKYLYKMNKNLT